MGHGRGKSATSYEKAPVAVADYNVTGELTPDATCNYFLAGTYNGKPYYRRADGAWFIWWDSGPSYWIISTSVDVYDPAYWFRSLTILGNYSAAGTATGIATVSAGPH